LRVTETNPLVDGDGSLPVGKSNLVGLQQCFADGGIAGVPQPNTGVFVLAVRSIRIGGTKLDLACEKIAVGKGVDTADESCHRYQTDEIEAANSSGELLLIFSWFTHRFVVGLVDWSFH